MECEICKGEIYGAVCDAYVVFVHETEHTYRHIDCNNNQQIKELEELKNKYRTERDLLKDIIMEKMR